MMFYKIEAELPALEPLLEKAACSERAAAMQAKIESRFMAADCVCFITVSSILDRKKKAMLCAAVKKGVLAEAAVKDFLKALDLEPGGLDIQEITLEIYFRMLQSSDRNGYIDDDDDVCEKLGIADLNARYRHLCPSFSETVLGGAATKKELLRSAEDLLCDSSLAVEIERIYQGAQEASAAGHAGAKGSAG